LVVNFCLPQVDKRIFNPHRSPAVVRSAAVFTLQLVRVRGGVGFWAEVDDLQNRDSKRYEMVQRLWWRLVEEGPELPDAYPTRVPLGKGWQDGFWIEIEDGSGFVEYVLIEEADGELCAVLYQLLWY